MAFKIPTFLDLTIADKLQELTKTQSLKLYQPMTLEGIDYPVTTETVQNLLLAYASEGIEPTEGVWYDVNSIAQSWILQEEYHIWLQEFISKLALRKTLCEKTFMNHKKVISVLKTVKAVKSYDLTTGWPS